MNLNIATYYTNDITTLIIIRYQMESAINNQFHIVTNNYASTFLFINMKKIVSFGNDKSAILYFTPLEQRHISVRDSESSTL